MRDGPLKRALRAFPPAARLNAALKARATRKGIAALAESYGRQAALRGLAYSKDQAVRLLRDRLSSRGIIANAKRAGHLRIFWFGANRDQDSSGFLQALDRCGVIRRFTNSEGGYGPLYSIGGAAIQRRDSRVVRENDRCLRKQFAAFAREGPVDLLLGQMWANYLSAGVLREIQQQGVVTANVSMDDRLPEHWGWHRGTRTGSVGLKDGLDLVLTSSPEACLHYLIEGCPAIFWPMASDPERFKPYPEAEKRHDVSFIGNKYGLRERIVSGLERRGLTIDTFGAGWPNGPAGPDASAEIFGRSRIILGIGTIAYNEDIYTLKLRDFDATMAGALYITHRNPDLLGIFREGRELECYSSVEECARKIRHYLDNPAERVAIAESAFRVAREKHTWQARFDELFEALGWARG